MSKSKLVILIGKLVSSNSLEFISKSLGPLWILVT